MALIDELSKENIAALKAHDNISRAVLSVTINRFKMEAIEEKAKGNEIGDKELVRIITKVLKELEEEKEGYIKANRQESIADVDKQIAVISKYLPKMLSEEEIRKEIEKLDDKSMPSIMKYFKMNFDGKVDMGLVNKIARSL